jgi:CRISPR-associated Cas5-like protein
MTGSDVWLRAEYEFAGLFSYRLPDHSSHHARSAPMPGPSAVKLALTATAMEANSSVTFGERLFYLVRDAAVGLQPPETIAMSQVFLRQLKPAHDGRLISSFGMREYVHLGGPMAIYLRVSPAAADVVADTMRRLRRIGTAESLLQCLSVRKETPDPTMIARPALDFTSVSTLQDLARRPVFRLKDIHRGTSFAEVNPFVKERASDAFRAEIYLFPMRIGRQGPNWTLYRREPFLVGEAGVRD